MATETDPGSVRIRWLVAGRFSAEPRVGSFSPGVKDLDARMADMVGEVRVRVPDRLGASETREVVLAPRSLRAFTLAGVIEAVPELKALRGLSERPPPAAAAPAAVEAVVGKGRLSAACASGSVRDALDASVFGTALDVLSSASLRGLEASWRGLRLLLAACPDGSGIHVEVIDCLSSAVADAVRARPPTENFEGADALFVVDPVESIETLAELADLGEELLAPCVATPSLASLGASSLDDLARRAEGAPPFPENWDELRSRDSSRWLCAAVNPVVLHAEGAGAYRRTCFGSPAWAVAAMLSASHRAQGAFALAVGKTGALTAPATRTVPDGPQRGKVAPTEAFFPIPAQTALAGRGILALGSVVDSDRVVLANAPMVASARDAAPLPAQLLTGRIVRFASWAKAQIDPGQSQEDVSTLMAQAAAFILFPGMSGAAAVGARVKDAGSGRVLEFGARVNPSHALVPLEIAFELPL
jgi:hypothetical protein